MIGTMKIEGLEPLLKLFAALPTRVVGKLVKPAMQEAGDMLRDNLRWKAYQQLQGAISRGYKDRDSTSLFKTARARAKIYKKGAITFVAVGFGYQEGGKHGHLVEFGHNIVKGGTLRRSWNRLPGITAAGTRLLSRMGWEKGEFEGSRTIKSGKNKGQLRPVKIKGWRIGGAGGRIEKGGFFKERYLGSRIRGGGRMTGSRTRAYPMLGPAFQTMARPMVLAIEQELAKIGPEAVRLAQSVGSKK